MSIKDEWAVAKAASGENRAILDMLTENKALKEQLALAAKALERVDTFLKSEGTFGELFGPVWIEVQSALTAIGHDMPNEQEGQK